MRNESCTINENALFNEHHIPVGKGRQMGEQDPLRVQAFLDSLRLCKGPRISDTELWEVFREHFPYKPSSPESRQLLAELLDEAEQQEIIQLPPKQGKRWDRALFPPLPISVQKRVLPSSQRPRHWQNFPWGQQLLWVADLESLSPEQEAFLLRVQEGFVQGTFRKQAPLKYRSLQLTGHEKRLGELARGSLFFPGRLSFEILGCVPEILPLALERVGQDNIALIVENVGTFRTAYNVLKEMPQPPYGWLGFGAGGGFKQSILHLKLPEHKMERIEYLGDIDRPGLSIAQFVRQLAEHEGLSPVIPAYGLHQAMLNSLKQLGYPGGIEYMAKEQRNDPNDESLISWLPNEIHQEVLQLIRAGKRVPEEVLGPDEMREVWDKRSNI